MSDPTTPGAVAEIARTLRPAFRVLPQLLEQLAKPGATELGLWIRDEVAAVRRRRLVALDAALERELVGRTPAAEPMDPVYVLDVLEGACRAGDDDVTRLWAKLLAANVATPATRHPLFVRALQSLSREDAIEFVEWCTDRNGYGRRHDEDGDVNARLHAAALLDRDVDGSMGMMAGPWLRYHYKLSGVGMQLGTALGLTEPRDPS